MTVNNGDDMRELAELYSLGGLEPDERKLVEERLHTEACRKALAQGTLATYAVAASAAQAPPRALRDRVLAVTRRPSAKSVPTRLPAWSQPGWLTAAAAAVVLVFAGTWIFESSRITGTWAAACTSTATRCAATGRVVALGSGQLRLETHGMQALPYGRVYQAWYIRAGAAPTPAPVFVPDARGDANVVIPVGAEKGLTVAVTVEPVGGSKAPTTKPFFVASIN